MPLLLSLTSASGILKITVLRINCYAPRCNIRKMQHDLNCRRQIKADINTRAQLWSITEDKGEGSTRMGKQSNGCGADTCTKQNQSSMNE